VTAVAVALRPNQQDIFTILGVFLTNLADVEVAIGQANRVPEAKADDFIVMWPLRVGIMSTTIDSYIDCAFTGAVAGNVLTVSAVRPGAGAIQPGATLYGPGVASGTKISALGSGAGGVGTYILTGAAQTVASEVLAAGLKGLTGELDVLIQVDVHGPNAWDNAQTIVNAYRDDTGVQMFNAAWVDQIRNQDFGLQPLYAEEPLQLPFTNEQDQVEDRYTIRLHMQANQTFYVSQDFADSVTVDIIDATAYPA
jgi:hypothetical protein